MFFAKALYSVLSRPTNAEIAVVKITWKIIEAEANLMYGAISGLFNRKVAK